MGEKNSEFLKNDLNSILEPLDRDDTIRQLVPLGKIELDPSFHYKNVNHWYIKRISKAMRHGKRVTPVVLSPHKDGFRVIRGNRRVVAAAEAGFEEIPAIIRKSSETENTGLMQSSIEPARKKVEKPKTEYKAEEKREILKQEAIKPNRQARRQRPKLEKREVIREEVIVKEEPKEEKIPSQTEYKFSVPLLPDLDKENQELQRSVDYLNHENERAQQELKKMRSEVRRFRVLLNQAIPAEGVDLNQKSHMDLPSRPSITKEKHSIETVEVNKEVFSKISDLEQNNTKLNESIELLQNDLNLNQQERQVIEEQLGTLADRNQELEQESRKLLLNIDRLEEGLIITENRLEKALQIEQEQNEQIEILTADIEKLQSEIQIQKKDIKNLEERLEFSEKERKDLKEFSEALKDDLKNISGERNQKQVEIQSLNNEISRLEEHIRTLNEEKITLETKIIKLSRDLTRTHQGKTFTAEEKIKLADKLKFSHERLNLINDELKYIQIDKDKKDQEYFRLSQEKDNIDSNYYIIKEEKIRLEERLKNAYENIEFYKNNLHKTEVKLLSISEQRDKLQDVYIKQKSKRTNFTKRVAKFEASKEALTKNYNRLEDRLSRAEADKIEVIEENSQLKNKIRNLEKDLNKANQKIDILINEKKSLYRYISKLLRQNKLLTDKVSNLSFQIDTFKEEGKAADKRIKELYRAEDNLKSKLEKITLERNKLLLVLEKTNQSESGYKHRISQLSREKNQLLKEKNILSKELKTLREKNFISGIFNGISQLQEKHRLLNETENKLEATKEMLSKTNEIEKSREKDLKKLEEEFNRAKAQIRIKQAEIEKVKAEKDSLNSKLDEQKALYDLVGVLKQNLEEEKNENLVLLEELNKLKDSIKELNRINKKLRKNAALAGQRNKESIAEIDSYKLKTDSFSKYIVKLRKIINKLEKEKEELKINADLYREEKNTSEKRLREAIDKQRKSNQRLDNFKVVTDQLAQDKINLEKEYSKIKAETNVLRKHFKDFRRRESTLIKELKDSKENISILTNQMIRITNLQGISNDERNNLFQMLKDVIQEKEQLERKLTGTINYGLDKIGLEKSISNLEKQFDHKLEIKKFKDSKKPN